MQTADLLDLSPLVASLERDLCRRYGLVPQRKRPETIYHVADVQPTRFANESSPLDVSAAVAAVDRVLATHPDAAWTVEGAFGRIRAGDLLLSLKFAAIDDDAELMAWTDAAGRIHD